MGDDVRRASATAPSRRRLRSGAALAAGTVLAALLPGCGSGPDVAADAAGCTTPTTGGSGATEISLQWAGPWDEQAAPDLIRGWDDRHDGVEVDVLDPVPWDAGTDRLRRAGPPTLVRVDASDVAALAASGTIRPLVGCLAVAGPRTGDAIEGVGDLGMVEDTRWALATNVDAVAMLVDRAALARAGLDPSRPPGTWIELVETARLLRDRLGMATPVAGLSPSMVLRDAELGPLPPDEATPYLDLLRDDLLLVPGQVRQQQLPPLGSGVSAVQFLGASELWRYASAIEQGQSPDGQLGIAPLPAGDGGGPSVPIVGGVWVIGAAASDREAAAAADLLEWLARDEQQAALHPLTDLLPTSRTAVGSAEVRDHWAEAPLVGELWQLMAGDASTPTGWRSTIGATAGVDAVLGAAGDGRSDLAVTWPPLVDGIAAATHPVDPAGADRLLDCIHPPDRPARGLDVCTGGTEVSSEGAGR